MTRRQSFAEPAALPRGLHWETQGGMPYIENQGAKIYWDEQGSGEPLLLLMGLAYPADMW